MYDFGFGNMLVVFGSLASGVASSAIYHLIKMVIASAQSCTTWSLTRLRCLMVIGYRLSRQKQGEFLIVGRHAAANKVDSDLPIAAVPLGRL